MWLVVRTGPDAGTAIELPEDRPFVLGRQRGCDLVVRDDRASRRHAELVPGGDGTVLLRDLGSVNGTFVDARRVADARLAGGEEVRIGDVVIEVTRARPPGPGDERTIVGLPDQDAPTPSAAPELATHSMVRRLVEAGTRRARRTALAAAAAALAAVASLAVLLATGTLGGDGQDRVPRVVARVAPSVVLVETLRGGRRTATGSGWVLDAGRGLVVTSAHVVNEGDRFGVVAAGTSRPAEVLAAAPCEDLALLRVGGTAGLHTARLAPPGSLEQGETVVALGFGAGAAAGDGVGSTTGVVSVPRTAFRDPAPDVPAYPEVVQTDTALNPGNSGGPLVDLEGRVVGVNAAARSAGADGRPLQNVNFAIGVDRARRVLADLQAGRGAAWTGLTFAYPTAQELRTARLPPGLRVTGALPGSPAARAGIRPGELLAGVDGRRLGTSLSSYCAAAGHLRPGAEVRLSFARPGRRDTREVRLRL